MNILDVFKKLGSVVKAAFGFAQERGLSDDVIAQAQTLVVEAAVKFVANADRREWVVSILISRGVPESIARLAIELAIQILKKAQRG